MTLPEPDLLVEMPDGRQVGLDDRGNRDGVPVLFFHGTPDTRLARHPDDGIAAALGVRLLAVDRPGLGGSDVDAASSPASVADDHARVLDHLGIDDASVVAWSAGAIAGLAFAGRHAARVRRLTLIAPLVPADAYGDPGVLEGAGDSRRLFADVLSTSAPDEAGRELAMWLVPPEIDEATAETMLADSLATVRHVEGARAALVAALRGSVARGMIGLEREIASQATPLGALLDQVQGIGGIHVGADDPVTPPAMSRWLGARLGLPVTTHDGEGHLLAITRWDALLREAAQEVRGQGERRAEQPRDSRSTGVADPAVRTPPQPSAASGADAASGSSQSREGTSDQRRSSS